MKSCAIEARSFLFVPANRPDRISKALASPADCIIVDLEDAVPPQDKLEARDQFANALTTLTTSDLERVVVRVNAAGTPWHDDDLRLLHDWIAPGLASVMISKSESSDSLRAAGAVLGPQARLLALVESLTGVDALDQICATPHVLRLAFGHLDFQFDLGLRCSADESELAFVRYAIVAASRRANLAAPVDGVTTETTNAERLRQDATRSRNFGFAAKLCIHPAQVQAVNEAFSPSADELGWARRVMAYAEQHAGAAFRLDGQMVDLPVIRRAQRTILAGR